ncbi:DUF2249 domain-containing protein [Cesiribacter andamanensis]|uniref:DUF2249 domain-containing protein n=1 Tax=Cesiribacter andamanensis AMV16 TaxID=1279009 RepID=M7N587_9BACT|nr:DUF2249 domain-containing protein [Cesiribacter andamanensis]EMR02386.1 hypothetical protein ADICEAN_02482 [Cesiribacter andamanensis AMV16]
MLKIINTFEPIPLIGLLKKKGYGHWTAALGDTCYETYFFRQTKPTDDTASILAAPQAGEAGWEALLQQYQNGLQQLDVRALEMPQPMICILDALAQLPHGQALYVRHKRLPLYLLPELAQRGYAYRSREVSETEVHLLIFPN